MSKRLTVLQAVCQLVADALPNAEVLGIDNDAIAPVKLPAGGRAIVRSGEPGEPGVTLGVLSYSYAHRIPVELAAHASGTLSREAAIDAMAAAIGAAVEADRTLGGEVEWLDLEALTTDDLYEPNAKAAKAGDLAIVAEYTTSNPVL